MPYYDKIDLHGHTVDSARRALTVKLKNISADVRELTVIHGCHGGTALQNLARCYKNSKIERKIIGINDGQTVFILKQGNKSK